MSSQIAWTKFLLVLRNIFYQAIKDHKDIAVEIAHYQRIEDDLNPDGSGTKHPDRSFGYLWNSINRFLRRTRRDANYKAQVAHLQATISNQRPKSAAAKARAKKKAEAIENPIRHKPKNNSHLFNLSYGSIS